ncbi:hypothetical protein ABWW58_09350 [Sporolactobacillus sp. STCC-11]|uniref:hypothetical protein n=1 Tax=Sporolactobacillus caesalpiniae TaxID=3230362 RepID=UPI003391795B
MKHRIRSLLMIQISFKKLYGYLTAFTLILPFLYVAYLVLTMIREKTDFHTLLLSHPLYSVMFMAVMLNLFWGYLLFQLSRDLDSTEGRNFSYVILVLLSICQLLAGNIVTAIMSAFVIMHSDAQLKDSFSIRNLLHYRLFTAMAAGLVLLSLLCSFALTRLTFFS